MNPLIRKTLPFGIQTFRERCEDRRVIQSVLNRFVNYTFCFTEACNRRAACWLNFLPLPPGIADPGSADLIPINVGDHDSVY